LVNVSFAPKADIRQRIEYVRLVPIADIAQQAAAVAAGQMTTYKSVSGGRHRSAVMQDSLLLPLLILLVVANGTAVGAKKLLGAASARPLDGGALFVDGQPIFGPSKTIRGIVVSVLATSICAALIDHIPESLFPLLASPGCCCR
jgi:hypothetical protein